MCFFVKEVRTLKIILLIFIYQKLIWVNKSKFKLENKVKNNKLIDFY